jgi:SAM-dependent methyltransferase
VSGAVDLIAELETIARGHDQSAGFTPRLIACRARTLAALLPRGRVLDLGCADGLLTAALAGAHREVVAVDASPLRLERTAARCAALGNVSLIEATFEGFEPSARFDGVVLSCILEHLPDAAGLLARVRRWLSPGGRAVAIVPNGASLHRRAGVLMGLLADLHDHGEADHELGHETVYDLEQLSALFEASGLAVVDRGGHLIKPLPNREMAGLPPGLVDAYEELGRQLPELAAEIWVAGSADVRGDGASR